MVNEEFLDGMRAAIPLAIGAGVFGIMLGVSASNAGMTMVEIGVMSATVFAGASQLVAVGMIDQAAPVLAIVTAVFAVNARHILMGATIAPLLSKSPPLLRFFALIVLVDETWAMASARAKSKPTGHAFFLGAACLLMPCWLITTVGGVAAGNVIADPQTFAIDFLGVAVFIGLLILIRPTKKDVLPFAIAAALSPIFSDILPGSWNIIAAACAGALVSALRPIRSGELTA